jgi:hypothetical protein
MREGILDTVVGLGSLVRRAQLSHAIELDDPGLVIRPRGCDTRAHRIAAPVPENDGLGPGAAGRRAQPHDLRNGHVGAPLDQLARLGDQAGDLQRLLLRFPVPKAHRRLKLEGAQTPGSHVEQLLHRAQRELGRAPGSEIPGDDRIAEPVGQRIGQDAGESLKGLQPGELGKGDRTLEREGQGKGRNRKPARRERFVVLEGDPAILFLRDRPDQPVPEPDLGHHHLRHGWISWRAGAVFPSA